MEHYRVWTASERRLNGYVEWADAWCSQSSGIPKQDHLVRTVKLVCALSIQELVRFSGGWWSYVKVVVNSSIIVEVEVVKMRPLVVVFNGIRLYIISLMACTHRAAREILQAVRGNSHVCAKLERAGKFLKRTNSLRAVNTINNNEDNVPLRKVDTRGGAGVAAQPAVAGVAAQLAVAAAAVAADRLELLVDVATAVGQVVVAGFANIVRVVFESFGAMERPG